MRRERNVHRSGGPRTGTTRRQLLTRAGAATGLVIAERLMRAATIQSRPSGDILLNHVGFLPRAAKQALVPGSPRGSFSLVAAADGRAVFKGELAPRRGDLGNFSVAEFGELRTPGKYKISTESGLSSGPFVIDSDPYGSAIAKAVKYFSVQRCGDSKTGYRTPCHTDDGKRADNGLHLDVTGGWHDACDLRKWVDATIYGMIGLARVAELLPARYDVAAILEEMRWGNQYFLKMQEPAGYVMDFCGGDTGNKHTDGIAGTADDRAIQVRPCVAAAQFRFIAAQAMMARLCVAAGDNEYAATCERAARRCMDWCMRTKVVGPSSAAATAVTAFVEMHRSWPEARSAERAAIFANRLLESFVRPAGDDATAAVTGGYFNYSQTKQQPAREIMHGNFHLLALCDVLEQFPKHADAPKWREAMTQHVRHLLAMSDRSAFGTIPFGLYVGSDPGGNRQLAPGLWYRWFMKTHGENPSSPEWWVGINAHLASNGIGLARAGRILGESRLVTLAQRQLDWILGANPFNASTVTDVGRNQPKLFATDEFKPPTPLIPGAVMTGIGGSETDELALNPGDWTTCEYWTPMVSYTMWLMSELTTLAPRRSRDSHRHGQSSGSRSATLHGFASCCHYLARCSSSP